MRKLMLVLAVLALAAIGIAACGGDDDSSSDGTTATDEPATTTEAPADDAGSDSGGASGSQVQLSADPSGALAYETDSLAGASTNVQIEFTNDSGTPHDVRVEDSAGTVLGGTDVFAGSTETADLELEPGEYTFFCSVAGHRQAGMEGTLSVE